MQNILDNLNVIYSSLSELSIWLKLILFIILIALFLILLKKNNLIENLDTKKEFTIKKNQDIYDKFYVGIYDDLFYKSFSNSYEVGTIINKTQPASESIILQIGSKTGNTINLLNKKNLNAIGSDIHPEFVNKSIEKFPNCRFSQNNPLNSMSYKSNSFTHILCLDLTIYTIKNKQLFINNCFNWLMPGGFFVVNLVNRESFNTIVPASNPLFLVNPQSYAAERITKSTVIFNDFKYQSNFVKINKDEYEFQEVISTPNLIRKQVEKYYIPSKQSIISIAKEQGFIVYAQINLAAGQKENQYLYIFLKPE